jgi:hypothetical protein
MVEEFGKKGLNVLALTNESRETVLKFMTQLTPAPVPYTIGLGGGSGNYPASGIPKAFLISAEGKVVWEGSPGAFPGKLLEAELKKVKVTDEMKAARAQKALDYAETLIAAKQYLRAANLLDRTVKDFGATEPGKKAQERRASLDRDEAMKKELAAQKAIDKAVGGIEIPKEKFKKKDREGVAKSLDALAKKNETDAPATAAMAKEWATIVREDWKAER